MATSVTLLLYSLIAAVLVTGLSSFMDEWGTKRRTKYGPEPILPSEIVQNNKAEKKDMTYVFSSAHRDIGG